LASLKFSGDGRVLKVTGRLEKHKTTAAKRGVDVHFHISV
jgi:hypothetical protein